MHARPTRGRVVSLCTAAGVADPAQKEDVRFDSRDPLFRSGAGMTYSRTN
jgi:hypothetical protein